MGVKVSTSKESDPVKNFHANYILEQKIGSGSYGVVFQARHRCVDQGRTLAVKIVPKNLHRRSPSEVKKRFEAEVDLLRNCRGKNIVELIQTFQNKHFCYYVMERAHCSVLQALIDSKNISESHIARIFAGMIEGIAQCHKMKVVHRDIKPQNFLLTQGTSIADEQCVIKVCDLGVAKKMPDGFDCLKGICGTSPFMAPEMLQNEGYSYNVDVWSLGVSAYLMLFGAFPYDPKTKDADDMQSMIKSGHMPISFEAEPEPEPYSDQPSEEAVTFLKKLLDRDPCSRPSAASVLIMPYIKRHRQPIQTLGRQIQQSRCKGLPSNIVKTEKLARLFENMDAHDKAKLKNMQVHNQQEQELQKLVAEFDTRYASSRYDTFSDIRYESSSPKTPMAMKFSKSISAP